MTNEQNNTDTDIIYERLDHYLLTYGSERSLLCASEVDGYFTSLACNKETLEPETWISAIWGTDEDQPEWDKKEEEEFFNLALIMYVNTMDCLERGELQPVYMETDFNGETEIIIDEWCTGFMRGAHITGLTRTGDKEFLDEVLAPVRLFGTERGWKKLETMGAEEVEFWQELIEPFIMRLVLENNPNLQLSEPDKAHVLH